MAAGSVPSRRRSRARHVTVSGPPPGTPLASSQSRFSELTAGPRLFGFLRLVTSGLMVDFFFGGRIIECLFLFLFLISMASEGFDILNAEKLIPTEGRDGDQVFEMLMIDG